MLGVIESGRTDFGFTFGASHTQSVWEDTRRSSWVGLVEVLTSHVPGTKEGSCLVPAVFSGSERKKEQAVQIDVAFLDSDSGATLDDIVAALKARNWEAVVSSTHSHMTTRTAVNKTNWDRYFAKNPDSDATAFLIEEKGYLPIVAEGAAVAGMRTVTNRGKDAEYVDIDHGECPKFRVAVPLLKPWRAADYPSQAVANDAWKSCIEALAAALSLPHDQACTDTSRLFYLPRRPPNGAVPETAVVSGECCDIFSLRAPEPDDLLTPRPGNLNGVHAPAAGRFEYADPITGEYIDLTTWARAHGRDFLIAKALHARKPSVITGLIVDNSKIHIDCPNNGAHTDPARDNATFVVNAGHGHTEGFVVHCRHGHCTGHDRLFFVRKMLEERWIEIDDLTAAEFQVERPAEQEAPESEAPQPTGPDHVDTSLPLVWFGEIEKVLDVKDFVQGVLVEQGAAVVYGESNAGKTFWTTDLALHVAAGREWNGRRVERGGVIYCVLEGGAGFRNRVAAWRTETGETDIPFAAIPASLNLLDKDADTQKLIDAIRVAQAKISVPVKLVVIDTLSRAMAGGNENAPDDMGALVLNMDRIREETKASLLFVHHSGKDQAKGARGHSSLRAAIDTEIEVVASETDDKAATVVKQRELPKGDVFGFTLKVVELGTNRHGEAVTTCIVAPKTVGDTGQIGTKKKGKLPASAALGARALGIALGKKGAYLPPTKEYPPNTFAVSATEWRAEFYQLKAGSNDTNKHAFSRAETDLLAAEIITARNGLVWFVKRDTAGQSERDKRDTAG